MKKLDTSNAQSLIYENDILKQTVLGGLKLEGLDRMRITLKVELIDSCRPPVRHNLDLYNDNQLEKFIRKLAEKFEIGTSLISISLSELTEQLENYRLEEIKKQDLEEVKINPLTKEEKQQAIAYLKGADLLKRTTEDLQQSGIQGEENNALILYLAMTSRKMSDPLSVICLAKSGMGKSYLMERVALCIPSNETKEHTQFSGNSFYYFKREEIKGTVFLIEDLDGAQAVMFPIRELQTKKRISKTVTMKDKQGQMRTVTLIVEGPVSVIGCTTREKIYEDNANRAILIYLDSSEAQDKRVMDYQKSRRAGLVEIQQELDIQTLLRNTQQVLEPIQVINPYAPLINIPKEDFKPRRTLPLLLNFIETITFYHQFQREQKVNETTGEVYIEVHPEDIELGFEVLKEVLFKKADELSGASRSFYEWLKDEKHPFINPLHNSGKGFYGSDIRKENRIQPRTLQRYLSELSSYGLLQITGGNKNTTGYTYKLNETKSFEQLKESINKQLEAVKTAVWDNYNSKTVSQ